MKVLFAAPYRDGTGYGQAAIQYILALDHVGVEVVPGLLKYNQRMADVPERILELEERDIRNPDVVIQNTVPTCFDYNSKAGKNIGLFYTETSNFKSQTDWVRLCNNMDQLWVASEDSVQHVMDSDVTVPTLSVPIPCDPAKYAKRYEPFPIPEVQEKFAFYFIAEYQRRKNLVTLLKAFHTEFHKREDVCLVLKVTVPGKSQKESLQEVIDCCTDVKRELGIYQRISDYHEEHIIADYLDEDEVMSLHSTCDCFVMPSFAEGWCMPAFDAMAMGKVPICSDIGGIRDFLGHGCGTLIPVQPEPVFGMSRWSQIPSLYTGTQRWWQCDIYELRQQMRMMFENKEAREQLARNGIDRAYDFSYEIIGNKMKEILDGQGKIGLLDWAAKKREKHYRTSMA